MEGHTGPSAKSLCPETCLFQALWSLSVHGETSQPWATLGHTLHRSGTPGTSWWLLDGSSPAAVSLHPSCPKESRACLLSPLSPQPRVVSLQIIPERVECFRTGWVLDCATEQGFFT